MHQKLSSFPTLLTKFHLTVNVDVSRLLPPDHRCYAAVELSYNTAPLLRRLVLPYCHAVIVLYTLVSTVYTVTLALPTVLCTGPAGSLPLSGLASIMEILRTWMANVHCKLYTVHLALYTVHCTLYTVHCTLYTVHCTL